MKRVTLLLALALLFSVALQAQKSKITSGVLALNNGDVPAAIEKLTEALAKPELVKKEKDLRKAHYYLHRAMYQVAVDTSLTELRNQYPDAAIQAKTHLAAATEGELGKPWTRQALMDQAENNLWAVLYNDGVNIFNSGFDTGERQDERALKYFLAAEDLDSTNFFNQRMLGATFLMIEDTLNTIKHLENAIDIFKSKYVDVDEETKQAMMEGPAYESELGQMSYLFQQLAVIYNNQDKPTEALAVISEGKAILGKDEGLTRQELGIYQSRPELFENAREKFEAAIAENPDDITIKLSYAGLLEQNKLTEEAFALYEQAYNADPQSLQANYGMGAYYINKAAALSEKKMEMKKDADIEKANEEIIELLKQAYPYMKWLHEKQPDNREWLSQLVTIAPIIGKDEEMAEYAKKLRTLNE
jgi:tetratricopeptide (TPR) repeat protein